MKFILQALLLILITIGAFALHPILGGIVMTALLLGIVE